MNNKTYEATREVKCPHCGTTLTIDEASYASIVQQVRNAEFNRAVELSKANLDRELSDAKSAHKAEIAAMEAAHKAQMDALAARKDREKDAALAQKKEELLLACSIANETAEKAKKELAVTKAQMEAAAATAESDKEAAIAAAEARLEATVSAAAADKEAAVSEARVEALQVSSERITELEAKLRASDAERQLAVNEAEYRAQSALAEKDSKISALVHQLEQREAEHSLALASQKREHELILRQKEDELDFYKDFKLRQSTKMLGETLEQHCLAAFDTMRHVGFQHAYFEKDNDASGGSKGDFIYRDFDENGVEFISAMLEMKNEADDTAHKHKNEDFFKKLDADRRAKGCEYAILVSTLESDSELYNAGIVDVSHRYPKMFVIRPAFLIPLLTILRNAALNVCEYRAEAEALRSQHLDVRALADKISDVKEKFSKSYEGANKHLDSAIAEIDKSIAHLEKSKAELIASAKQLGYASDKLEALDLKRLTRGNPTMRRKLADAGISLTTAPCTTDRKREVTSEGKPLSA